MCGRFTSTTPAQDLATHFGAELLAAERLVGPRWNVAPTTGVWVLHTRDGRRLMETMRWGLVPSWATDPSIGSRMINARAETVATKPSYRGPLRTGRCAVPADGFYEWASVPGQRRKQPWYFCDPEERPLAFAGLHATWRGPDPDAPVLRTCTVITTAADDIVGPVHDRMPAVLDGDALEAWLDPGLDDPAVAEALLAEARRNHLVARPVGLAVNRAGNEGPELIEAIDAR